MAITYISSIGGDLGTFGTNYIALTGKLAKIKTPILRRPMNDICHLCTKAIDKINLQNA